MPQNLKTAVVGLAFAVLAIAGYQFIYKVGIWRPNASTRSAIDEALGRADRITAQQAREDLNALFARAEKGERLDRAELERLIKAAAKDAGDLDGLWKEAEAKSRGQVVAPPPSQPAPQEPTQARSQPAPDTSAAPASPPRPASDGFFGSRIAFQGGWHPRWTRINRELDAPFALEISGEFSTFDQTRFHSRRTAFNFRGVPYSDLVLNRQLNSEMGHDLGSGAMDLPNANFHALIARYCDHGGCSPPFVVNETPFGVCPKPGSWLEMKFNGMDLIEHTPGYRGVGQINLTPVRVAAGACSGGQS